MQTQTIKILLVEDNLGDARLLWEFLGEVIPARFHLMHVQRLSRALERLQEESYDVVLVDLGLPDSHGLDTIVRVGVQAPGSAIVVLTGLEDEALALEALREGAQDYLVKGQFSGQVLVRSLRYAVERKKAEERIHQLNEELEQRVLQRTRELEAIQSSMTEGLVAINAAGQIATFNQAAASMVGLEPQQVLGRSVLEVLRSLAPRFQEQDTVKQLEMALASTLSLPATIEAVVIEPERRECCIVVFHIPFESPGESMTGFLLRDVTHERAEGRRKEAFISMASHELRTPLTSLIGFVELLLQHQVSPATQHTWLELVLQEALRLATIVEEMLELSRIQSGTIQVRLAPVSLRDTVKRVLRGVAANASAHAFQMDIPPETPTVSADADKLARVLLNLLDNAVKYSPNGGTITVDIEHGPTDAAVIVRVADQGMGISLRAQENLFTPFYRVRQPGTENIPGTGLGMYIVKSLVESMNGRVWLKSAEGQGTTLFVSLQTDSGFGGHAHLDHMVVESQPGLPPRELP